MKGVRSLNRGKVPTAHGKQGKWPKTNLSWKTQRIQKFCQNTGKTQGIWFAQVINSLIIKVKDILVFAVNISKLFLKSLLSQFCVCNSHNACNLAN